MRGPGEPDNRPWLALKQSGNPLDSAGPPCQNTESPPTSEVPRPWALAQRAPVKARFQASPGLIPEIPRFDSGDPPV